MMSRLFLLLAGILGALGVAIAAYHAHGLEKSLLDQGLAAEEVATRMKQCETAVRYHLIHAVAILAVSASTLCEYRLTRVAAWLWFSGILLFSGGLYSMVYLGKMGHWAIVPLGGLSLILGWLALAVLASAWPRNES